MKKLHLAIISLVVAILAIFWSIGVATDLFASSLFSSFWWLSYQDAHYSQFLVLSLGGSALLVGISFWNIHNEKT